MGGHSPRPFLFIIAHTHHRPAVALFSPHYLGSPRDITISILFIFENQTRIRGCLLPLTVCIDRFGYRLQGSRLRNSLPFDPAAIGPHLPHWCSNSQHLARVEYYVGQLPLSAD
eukprot:m.230007 g.230007  ORF g.230007 m.230007 type:complete len:114 (+) comp26014_c1_seq1:1053-1394(+)